MSALRGLGDRSPAQPAATAEYLAHLLRVTGFPVAHAVFGPIASRASSHPLGRVCGVSPVSTHCKPQNLWGILRLWVPLTYTRRTPSSQSPDTLKQPRTPTRPRRSLWSPMPLASPTLAPGSAPNCPFEDATPSGGPDLLIFLVGAVNPLGEPEL